MFDALLIGFFIGVAVGTGATAFVIFKNIFKDN